MATYQSDGGLTLGGCATIEIIRLYPVAFSIGSKVYIKEEANKGVFEAVVIKRINRVSGIINYVDTFNRIWLENELVAQSVAQSLAKTYKQNLINETEEALITNCAR